MTDILKANAEIAARFEIVKERVRTSTTVPELFSSWYRSMGEVFGIPFLWVSLMEDELAEPLKTALFSLEEFQYRLNFINRKTFEALTGGLREPILVSGDIRPYFPLFPRHRYLLRSMAIAPFTLGDEVVGSLNHGDPSPFRYTPDMDTTLLSSLTSAISFRLTEIISFP